MANSNNCTCCGDHVAPPAPMYSSSLHCPGSEWWLCGWCRAVEQGAIEAAGTYNLPDLLKTYGAKVKEG